MIISSLELWNDLEVKVLNLASNIEPRDEILYLKLKGLVNTFNGNMGKNMQFVCIEKIETICDNLKRESYYDDRNYKEGDRNSCKEVLEDLYMIVKVLKSERNEYNLNLSKKTDVKDENRLPNINEDKSIKMYNYDDGGIRNERF